MNYLKPTLALLLVSLFSLNGHSQSTSPGDVKNDLVMWLKANDGITLSGVEVTAWDDQSKNNSFTALKENQAGFSGPEFLAEELNFNPALRFDGSDYLAIDYTDNKAIDLNIDPSAGDKMTIFSVFTLADADSEGTIVSKGTEATRNYQVWLGEFDRVMHYTLGRDTAGGDEGHHWGDGVLDARYEAKISRGVVDEVITSHINSRQDTFIRNDGIGNGNANMDILVGARRNFNNNDVGFLLKGDLAELIIYNEALTSAEINRVESYLAIKYGITLGYNDSQAYTGTSDNYYASDGSVIWNGTTNAGWGFNVFGVARDDDSDLIQLKSRSANVQRNTATSPPTIFDAILTIESESGAIENDKSYLLVGHNGGDISLQSASVPTRATDLLNRLWVAREGANDVGNVTLTFNLSQYTGSTISNPKNLDLFVADNTAMTNYTNYQGTYNAGTGELTFTGINLKDAEYLTLGTPVVIAGSNRLEFDGVDDYITGINESLSLFNQSNTNGITIMGWIKSDSDVSDTTTKFVFGERDAIELFITDEDIRAYIHTVSSTGSNSTNDVYRTTTGIERGIWRHVGITVDFVNNEASLLLDGEWVFITNLIDAVRFQSEDTTVEETFRMGNDPSLLASQYFQGDIDELRIFDRIVSEEDIKEMMYQEIENNGGNIRGSILPNNISNYNWSDLASYQPMSNIRGNMLYNESSARYDSKLNFIDNIQPQTAPLPYTTIQDGDWSDKNTWTHGDMWFIPGDEVSEAATFGNDERVHWGIYHIRNNITLTTSMSETALPRATEGIEALGLIIDEEDALNNPISFTIGDGSEDFQVNVSRYFELNGALDLTGDSQLIQGSNSNLVTSANGKILRRQEGNSDVYWYNYWSSPVGSLSTTTLTNNNGTSNNTNNTTFNLAMLKDGTGTAMEFTSNWDEVGKISNRWLYSFQNGQDYYGWSALTPSSSLVPGVGYTQKGTGMANADGLQEYIFEGKPNNGTILVAADDVDGDTTTESDDGSRTTTLIGNPYPSALDARQFIIDNSGTINGTILLWEQWAGNSHILAEYQGGYGYINTMATARAYQYQGVEIADPVDPMARGIKTPRFNIPVGQGFFVEVISDSGNIEFNNGQRIFIKESDADGNNSPNSGSVFSRSANNHDIQDGEAEEENPYQLIRMEFKTSGGASRRFVLGFSETATDGFDYGLDGGYVNDLPEDDMGSILNNKQYVIQAFAPITPEKEIDLTINVSGDYNYSLEAVEFSNLDENQEVYLRDNLTNTYFNLRNGNAYEFTSAPGQFNDRFYIVFKNSQTLSNEDILLENTLIYMNNLEEKLFIKGLNQDAKSITLTNMLGQNLKSMVDVSNNTMENGIIIHNLNSGIYVVNIETEGNDQLSKKIILE